MKYARMIYGNNKKQSKYFQYINLGDYIQTFAIDNIYKIMNIPQSNIVSIDGFNMSEYTGELISVPMQGWFGFIKGRKVFPIKDSIRPVFIGYHCITDAYYTEECLDTYRRYSPIGCRDEATMKKMREHGINSYLTGCLTVTLPEREFVPKEQHIFLVDPPKDIEKFIPQSLKKNITYITHEILQDSKNYNEAEIKRAEELSLKLLERYKNEATLVITSRLHCAGPCLGMGIPVILARNYFDERYSWIGKYLPLYTPDQFENIDWNPQKVDLSDIKPKLINMAQKMLLDACDKEAIMREVHEFYMDREKENVKVPFYVNSYLKMHEKFPKIADLLREVVFKRITVATARGKSEK